MLRVRLYKVVPTPLGTAEIELLDVPLSPDNWHPKDEKAVVRLEKMATR